MRGKYLIAAAVLVLAAGCSEGAAPVEPAEAPAPVKAGREGAYEAAGGEAEGFVRALYAMYATPGEAPAPGREPLYSRTLNALVGEDFRRSGGKPSLDRDPVCDCTGGTVVLTSVAVAQADRDNADAAVVFTVDGQEKRQTLKLVREATTWRVADVAIDGREPLAARLLKAIG